MDILRIRFRRVFRADGCLFFSISNPLCISEKESPNFVFIEYLPGIMTIITTI